MFSFGFRVQVVQPECVEAPAAQNSGGHTWTTSRVAAHVAKWIGFQSVKHPSHAQEGKDELREMEFLGIRCAWTRTGISLRDRPDVRTMMDEWHMMS